MLIAIVAIICLLLLSPLEGMLLPRLNLPFSFSSFNQLEYPFSSHEHNFTHNLSTVESGQYKASGHASYPWQQREKCLGWLLFSAL